jgi:chromosome segregation ATPase
LPKPHTAFIFVSAMKYRIGLIVLIVICVGLGIGWIWSQRSASEHLTAVADRVGALSNQVVNTRADLEKQVQVNMELESDRTRQKQALNSLTNLYSEATSNLEKTAATLRATQDEMVKQVAQRDTRISELESQNQALDQRALDLSSSITNLTVQINDTRQKLLASEGNKSFLEGELRRLMAEKSELERQFNDIAVLRTQVAKLKQEMNISRRLDWIRKGLFATDSQKGAERLMNLAAESAQKSTPPPPKPAYDLNVEVNSDGTVRVIPPATNAPTAAAPQPAK